MFTITLVMWGCPKYGVYEQNLKGEAELARAAQNRQISVQEAEAKKESAKALADAEVIRAQGVAKANKIIGESLKNNEVYLHYLWLQTLEQSKGETIYIPTEANFPLMEAGRLNKPTK
jgi:regulator of protease activity HflC (stomatin/prohibitin superfamily)